MIRTPEPFTAALPQARSTYLDAPFVAAPANPIGTAFLWDAGAAGVRPITRAWEPAVPGNGNGGGTAYPNDPGYQPPTHALPGFMADLGATVFDDLTIGKFAAQGDWQAFYDDTEFHASVLTEESLDYTYFTLA